MQTWHSTPPEHASVARDVPKTWTINFFFTAKRHTRYCGLVCGPQMGTTSGIHNCLHVCVIFIVYTWFQKQHSTRKNTGKVNLNLRKKLVKCYIRSISFVWCWNLDTADITRGILGKFWNVVPKKDGNQIDRSREKYYMESIRRGISHKLLKKKG
jgi:hypothetical protein